MPNENQEALSENEDEGVEIEIDSPETEDQSSETEVASAGEEPAGAEEPDELSSYSAKVQTRISNLTKKYRKEESDREEAVRMAQQLLNENTSLKSRLQNMDKGYLSEYGTRLEAQIETAKRAYREAHDNGDTDKLLEAQDSLSKMSIDQERLRIAKQRAERPQQPEQQAQQNQQPVQQSAAPKQERKADPKAEGWAEKNEWFGSDKAMTFTAFEIHKNLVEEEGFDPAADDYYSEVDRRMRKEFPHKFQAAKKSGGAQVAPAGASATRSTAKTGRRSVKLSPSQIAMAKRLNVPLEEYAKYVKD